MKRRALGAAQAGFNICQDSVGFHIRRYEDSRHYILVHRHMNTSRVAKGLKSEGRRKTVVMLRPKGQGSGSNLSRCMRKGQY